MYRDRTWARDRGITRIGGRETGPTHPAARRVPQLHHTDRRLVDVDLSGIDRNYTAVVGAAGILWVSTVGDAQDRRSRSNWTGRTGWFQHSDHNAGRDHRNGNGRRQFPVGPPPQSFGGRCVGGHDVRLRTTSGPFVFPIIEIGHTARVQESGDGFPGWQGPAAGCLGQRSLGTVRDPGHRSIRWPACAFAGSAQIDGEPLQRRARGIKWSLRSAHHMSSRKERQTRYRHHSIGRIPRSCDVRTPGSYRTL